jgi:hypothetical protein
MVVVADYATYSRRASLIDSCLEVTTGEDLQTCKCRPLHARMMNWHNCYKSNKKGSALPTFIRAWYA